MTESAPDYEPTNPMAFEGEARDRLAAAGAEQVDELNETETGAPEPTEAEDPDPAPDDPMPDDEGEGDGDDDPPAA